MMMLMIQVRESKMKGFHLEFGEIDATTIIGGEAEETVRKILEHDTIKCWGICFKDTATTDIRAYPHEGGLADGEGERWWIYVHCNNFLKRAKRACDYDTSWGKIREIRGEQI